MDVGERGLMLERERVDVGGGGVDVEERGWMLERERGLML